MNFSKGKHLKLVVGSVVALVMGLFGPAFVGTASAAPQFTAAYVRLDSETALAHTGGTVCATPSTSSTEAAVKVTFPTVISGTDFVVSTTVANWTVTTTNLPTGAAAWPGIAAATAVSGKTVTFPSSTMTISTYYCFNFAGTNTLTNSSAGYQFNTASQANITTYTSAPAIIEQTNWNTAIITDDTIAVSAIVPPLFQIIFLAGNTDSLGNLDPGNVISSAGVPVQFKTNAKAGWIAWAKDSQAGLHSATAGYTIHSTGSVGTPNTVVATTEQYVLNVGVNGGAVLGDGTPLCPLDPGTATLTTDPGVTGGSAVGGTLTTNFQEIANCSGGVPSTSAGDILMLTERAAISYSTPAATDYSDVITVVGAGNF